MYGLNVQKLDHSQKEDRR